MLRPVERIGLYILFALMAVMFLVLLTEVVWGHETRSTRETTYSVKVGEDTEGKGIYEMRGPERRHVHAGDVPIAELERVEELAIGCGHVHYVINETAISGDVLTIKNQVACYDLGAEPETAPEKVAVEPESTPTPPTLTVASPVEQIPEMLDEVVESEPEVEIKVPAVELESEPVELSRFEIQFWQGWTLMCFPVLPESVSTVADLYDEWDFFTEFNGQIVLLVDGCWVTYSGDRADVVGAITLSAVTGLAIRLDWAAYLGVRGVLLPSPDVVQLQAGSNLLGLPRLPVGAVKPSDLLSDVICAVLLERKGKFYLVGRVGDPGDEFPLVVGQAVLLISLSPVEIRFNALETAENVAVGGWGNMKTAD